MRRRAVVNHAEHIANPCLFSASFETAQVLANDKHKWYYASKLGPDEALLFKQFDTKTDGRARQTPHTAFQSKEDDGPPRQSM